MGLLLVKLVLHILTEILHFVSVSSKVLDGSINNHAGCIVCILKCDLKALIAFIITLVALMNLFVYNSLNIARGTKDKGY